MLGEGKGHNTAGGEAIPRLACRSGAGSSSSQPCLDFVGKMKTFHTSIDIPGTTAMVHIRPLSPHINARVLPAFRHAQWLMPPWKPACEVT